MKHEPRPAIHMEKHVGLVKGPILNYHSLFLLPLEEGMRLTPTITYQVLAANSVVILCIHSMILIKEFSLVNKYSLSLLQG